MDRILEAWRWLWWVSAQGCLMLVGGGSGGSGGCMSCVDVGACVLSPLSGARPLAWLSVLTSVLRAGMLIVCAIRVLDVTTRCYSRRVLAVGGEYRSLHPSRRIAVLRGQRVHTSSYGSRWAERAVLGVQNPCQTRPSSPLPVSEPLARLDDHTRGHLSQLNPCCRAV